MFLEEMLIRSKSRVYAADVDEHADDILQALTALFSKVEDQSNATSYWA